MKRAALYVRVSTEEQKLHGMSIDTQITALQEYCEEHGYEIYNIYNDAGFSARKSYKKRPGLLKMIEDCQNFDIILFTRLDRFTRSVKDYYSILAKLNDKPWRAIWENYSTTTPDDVFKTNIMLSVAQAEADKTSARLKDSYQYRKAKGIYYGKAPMGYLNHNGQLVKDPDTKDGIQAMFNTFLKTLSQTEAMFKAKEYGVLFSKNNLGKILKNPVYSGKSRNGHLCEPYITPEDHEFIVSIKKNRTPKPKAKPTVYIFSGLLVCGYCGRRLAGKRRGVISADGSQKYYERYVCQGTSSTANSCPRGLSISATKIENVMLDCLDKKIGHIKYKVKISKGNIKEKLKHKKQLEQKLERAKELYIEGEIDKETYQAKKFTIERDLSRIVINNEKIPELPKGWKNIYLDLYPENRRVFWQRVIDKIILTNENKENPEVIFRV